jgi:hypothetical protein
LPEQENVMSVLYSLQGHEALLAEFSTVLAVLAAFALWPIPCVRWLAALVALFIATVTLTTGWFFGVDALAGALLALVCCRLGMALVSLGNPRPRPESNQRRNG